MPRSAPPPGLDALPAETLRPIRAARALARKDGKALYVAGGAVRDLFLRRPVTDIDLVVESDGPRFARRLARELGSAVAVHARFGTATLALPGGARLDLSTARAEDYAHPGALPRVRAGTIEDDLARRDFTVNAMALEIARSESARLLDRFGGRDDLRRRVIRMLHPLSPFDDPTRSFRAIRYANRLGFRIERTTRGWIRKAVAAGAVDRVSGDRLRRELALLFSEGRRAAAAREMASLGLARAVHPALRYDAKTGRRLAAAERIAAHAEPAPSWLAYLLVWAADAPEAALLAVAARLNLPSAASKVVGSWPERRRALDGAERLPRAALASAIDTLPADAFVAAAAVARPESRRALLEARKLAPGFRLRIRGRDLLEAGVPPGPAIGRALSATLSARRDGAIRPEDELEFALKAARS